MNFTKEDIYDGVRKVLVEQFEIEAESITPEARLREDLDIDSIDAVDLMIEMKNFTEKKMSLEDFHQVETISDVVDTVFRVAAQEQSSEES